MVCATVNKDLDTSNDFAKSFLDQPRVKESEEKDLCDITGHIGPWQLRTFFILILISFSCTWHNLILTFQSPNVPHWCKSSRNSTNLAGNLRPQCYDEHHKCKTWIYDNTLFKSTIVDEWDLVCDRKWLMSFAKSVFMFGHLVAALVCSPLTDKIGRRPVILICYSIFWVCAILTTFANSVGVFLFLRFLVALGATACYTSAFVILMEVVGSEVRSVYGVATKFGWTLGNITLPGVAWFIRDWRYLQLAITLPWISMVAMWWLLEESPRWLLITGRVEKAEALLTEACIRNGKNLEDIEVPLLKLCARVLKDKEVLSKKEDVTDILKYPNLKRATLYLCFIWFTTAFVFYALAWGTNDLQGDPFWNFFVSGLVEIPATLVSIFMAKNYGRRKSLANTAFIAGGALTLYSCLVATNREEGTLFLFMFAKFCISIAFGLLYVFSSELFPTVVRGLGLGYCSTVARLGAILAPFATHMGGPNQPHLCYWTYGLLTVTCGLCILVLPETSNRKLPETLVEGESFHRNDVIISCRNLMNP